MHQFASPRKWARVQPRNTHARQEHVLSQDVVGESALEIELVLRCARPVSDTLNNARILQLLERGNIDWVVVLQMARSHGVIPLVYRALRDVPDSLVHDASMNAIRKDFHTIGLLIQLQVKALKQLEATLESNKIAHLVFKGLPLGSEAYGNPIWRKPGDLDILIEDQEYERVKVLLTGLGYHIDVPEERDEAQHFRRQHQMTFRGTHCDIDVHCTLQQRSFFKKPYAATFDNEAIWERSRMVTVEGSPIPCLSPEDLLCLLCVHGAKHGWFKLYLIVDLAAYISSVPLDWQRVMALGKRLKATRLIHLGIHLAERLFGVRLPRSIASVICEDRTLSNLGDRILHRLFNDPGHEKPLEFHSIQISLFRRWPEKFSYLFLVGLQHVRRKREERGKGLAESVV